MLGCRLAQKAGRSGWPNILQRFSPSSCTQRMPAGLPFGMPGIGLLILGAVQQAPQFSLHCILYIYYEKKYMPCKPHGYWPAGQILLIGVFMHICKYFLWIAAPKLKALARNNEIEI
jgi:hypothetical protein